jgi:hypothetical protein
MLTLSGVYSHLRIGSLTASNPTHFISLAVAFGTDATTRRDKSREIAQKVPVLFHDEAGVREWESFLRRAHRFHGRGGGAADLRGQSPKRRTAAADPRAQLTI